jgi:hypothetical protein
MTVLLCRATLSSHRSQPDRHVLTSHRTNTNTAVNTAKLLSDDGIWLSIWNRVVTSSSMMLLIGDGDGDGVDVAVEE